MVRAGTDGIRFFAQVRSYFRWDDPEDFWQRVMFMNYLPDCVGTSDRRYDCGTPDQITRARERFFRVLDEHRPQKVLVFTNGHNKGWSTLPRLDEEQVTGGRALRLGADFPSNFSWGHYTRPGHVAQAFGLRHPQGARTDLMSRAVQHILAVPRSGG